MTALGRINPGRGGWRRGARREVARGERGGAGWTHAKGNRWLPFAWRVAGASGAGKGGAGATGAGSGTREMKGGKEERGKGGKRRKGGKGEMARSTQAGGGKKALFGLEGPPRDPFCAGPGSQLESTSWKLTTTPPEPSPVRLRTRLRNPPRARLRTRPLLRSYGLAASGVVGLRDRNANGMF